MATGAGGLEGKTALAAGGTGRVGREVARAFLRSGGARVLVPSRGEEALDAPRNHLGGENGRLVPIVAYLPTAESLAAVADRALAHGGALDAVAAVANSRSGWGKGLLDTDDDAWRSVLEGGLTLHFRIARAFLPFLAGRENANYTFVNGGLAETPTPGVGPVCASAAGQPMLARVLAAETEGAGVRINTLLINSMVRDGEPDDTGGGRHPERVTAGDVGRAAAFLASPAGAFLRRATVAVNQMRPERADAVASVRARRRPQAGAPA